MSKGINKNLISGLEEAFTNKIIKPVDRETQKELKGEKQQKKFVGIGDPLPLPDFSKPKLPPSQNRGRQLLSNYYSNYFYGRR